MKRLIESFVNLVDQHSGKKWSGLLEIISFFVDKIMIVILVCLFLNSGIRKRVVNNPQQYPQNESLFPVFGRNRDYYLYPLNDYQGDLEPLKEEIIKLKNFNIEI